MELIDTHCHLDVEAFDTDREAVLTRCRQSAINTLVIPAIEAAAWDRVEALCDDDEGLFPALGLHPVFLESHRDSDVSALTDRVATRPPVAIGEIGLDFYLRDLNRDRQLQLFEQQLLVARDAGLPVILHVRKAHDEVLSLLRRCAVKGGICHAFNGSVEQGRHYIDLGFCLGFGGMLTYDRSSRLRALARELPLESIVLETDAPDMTVAQHHGERNSPEYLPYCLQALSEAREEPPAQVARQTTANARRVLTLDSHV